MLRSTRNQIPIVQLGFFRPVIEQLEAAGASTATHLRRTSLHRFDLSDNENYVPVTLMYRFFEEIKRDQGIDDFFGVFADRINAQGSCDWLDVVGYSADLLSAINFAVKYQDVVLSHQRMSLGIDGPTSKFSMTYLDQARYLERPTLGREFTDYTDLCLLYNLWRQAGGPAWQPIELHLQSLRVPNNLDGLLPAGSDTKVYLGQPATAVVFPTTMLSIPLWESSSRASTQSFQDSPQSLSGVIEKLLNSGRRGQTANLRLIADMLDLSPRTLRRRLLEEGTTFSEVVDTWRFKSSLELLGRAGMRINEMAERLGYANSPNFERAFKRWTGRSPGAYRDALR